PRPERPEFVERLNAMIPYYSQRHLIKPGLTGWAQIKYPYGASIDDAVQKLQYDLYYIKNRSLVLDAVIVFETTKTVLFGRGAR
ncbi:MAG TPA: sugar transferase, partial [Blastocatellia bacterium]|nr:sugar transferase [Blastocatellia bacterium]